MTVQEKIELAKGDVLRRAGMRVEIRGLRRGADGTVEAELYQPDVDLLYGEWFAVRAMLDAGWVVDKGGVA